MYSYIWNTDVLHIEKTHISKKYNVEYIVPLMWREHCLECSMPLCYSTCPIYAKRMDGRCLRFSHGITPVLFDGEIKFGAMIEMRRWAKLQTNFPIYPRLISSSKNNYRAKQISKFEKIVRRSCDFFHNYKVAQGFASIMERINTTYSNRVGVVPDGFLAVICNMEKTERVLVLEMLEDDKSIFKSSFTLTEGWNEFFIQYSDIILPSVNSKKVQLRAYLSNDATAKLIFESFDFVKIKHNNPVLPAKKVKCVAWDLDNTMWKGVIGDDGKDSVVPFDQSLQLVKKLDERGIIQTIASKNTPEIAWEKIVEMGLEEFFLYPAINWGRKSQSLLNIAKELNINIDTFAMIDDSAFERSEISTALPQVRVYDVEDIPYLLDKQEFNVPVTDESKNRRLSYLSEYKRKNLSSSWDGDYDSFLRSCELVMDVFVPCGKKEQERCLELILRSNQYNISGKKYSNEEFYNMLNSSQYECFAYSVKDNYGDYGIVGFVSFERSGNNYKLNDFVMSCRVAMKKVERAFFNWIVSKKQGTSFEKLIINGIKTARNAPLREQLLNMPFELIEDKEESFVMSFDLKNEFVDDKIIKIYAQ